MQARVNDLERDRAEAREECLRVNRLRDRDIQVFNLQEGHIQKLESSNADL